MRAVDWSRENLDPFEKNFYKASESSRQSIFSLHQKDKASPTLDEIVNFVCRNWAKIQISCLKAMYFIYSVEVFSNC